jgi:hypothetical protein
MTICPSFRSRKRCTLHGKGDRRGKEEGGDRVNSIMNRRVNIFNRNVLSRVKKRDILSGVKLGKRMRVTLLEIRTK